MLGDRARENLLANCVLATRSPEPSGHNGKQMKRVAVGLGWAPPHFLMKTVPKVAAEMALHPLAYNLTRVMNIIGIKPLTAAIEA